MPNTDLLHNHQLELAEELAAQGYVVHGKLTWVFSDKPANSDVDSAPRDLASAIPESERLRKRKNEWPPINSGDPAQQRGLAGVMDDEMGWVD